MKSGRWQRRAALFVLIVSSLDLALKLVDWRETFDSIPWWGSALALAGRFAFMGFFLFLYVRLKKAPKEPAPVTRAMKNASVRSMRVLHLVFLAAIVGYLYVAERFLQSTKDVPISLVESLAIVAVIMVVIAFIFRRTLLASAIKGLQRNASDATALGRWRTANILSMVLAVSVSMYGFALRVTGSSRRVSWPFFIVSIVLMLLWTPRLNEENTDTAVSSSFGD
jgi:hypothetical protein